MGEMPNSTTMSEPSRPTCLLAGRFAMTEVAATGAPAYTETLPRVAESARLARLLVAHALTVWEQDELTDEAMLVVTELVANAVDHARGDSIRVTVIRLAEHRLRVEVVDRSRVQPVLRAADAHDVAGRGLALIEAVSVRWGTDLLRWGKRVWVDLGRTAAGKEGAR
ncbi:ATP-binding protein [Streptomyces sp. NPDC127033]|uniref:ATP-binding protein n=1 Tax=Streptomyces sp. NPDC127033 TaxID=3347110 RepID=UPI00364FA3DB